MLAARVALVVTRSALGVLATGAVEVGAGPSNSADRARSSSSSADESPWISSGKCHRAARVVQRATSMSTGRFW